MISRFTGKADFLSNFHPWQADWDGVVYPTAEHAFQAAKTLDKMDQAAIYSAKSPVLAKRLGRRVQLRDDWDEFRLEAMEHIVRSKFSNLFGEREIYLLSTNGHELVEGNYWHDQFWGDCTCRRRFCKEPGENNLGKILMKVREELSYANTVSA